MCKSGQAKNKHVADALTNLAAREDALSERGLWYWIVTECNQILEDEFEGVISDTEATTKLAELNVQLAERLLVK